MDLLAVNSKFRFENLFKSQLMATWMQPIDTNRFLLLRGGTVKLHPKSQYCKSNGWLTTLLIQSTSYIVTGLHLLFQIWVAFGKIRGQMTPRTRLLVCLLLFSTLPYEPKLTQFVGHAIEEICLSETVMTRDHGVAQEGILLKMEEQNRWRSA